VAAPRTDVDVSLHRALRAARPDVRPMLASKATLVVTSHVIEDLVAGAEGGHVLFSGFQHDRHWAYERDRYLELADASEVIAVFAGREPPPGWGVDHVGVRLRAGDPLTQEWFVLALGPEVAVTLCGLDADEPGDEDEEGAAADEGARLFEVIWSFDPDLARTAAGVVLDALERVAPERAARAAEAVRDLAPPPADAAGVAREADAMVAAMVDRIERLRGRERLAERHAAEARGAFLAQLGTELRAPLNALLGFTQLLQLEPERPQEDREGLEQIAAAGRQVLRLVDDALDLARAETGGLPLALGAVDAHAALADALEAASPQAQARGVRLAGPTAADGARVRADPDRVRAVLGALLARAVAATPEDGEVRAEVVAGPRDTVRVEVRDRGPTIPADEVPRLFTPFAPGTRRGGDDDAIGLPLAQRITQAMGGRIEVHGRSQGGSTLALVLPAAPEPRRRPAAGPHARPRVLHVAGDPADLRLVERLLATHADVELLGATRGADALALARELPLDLVLLDLDLPDRPGLDVLRTLRSARATSAVPVVALTGDPSPDAQRLAQEAGASEQLPKPLDVRRLLATVVAQVGPAGEQDED